MVEIATDGERNQGHRGGFAAMPKPWQTERSRSRRSKEIARWHADYLYGEGRPVLFLAGLCGLVGALFAPVAMSLSLPFFAAGLGAIAVSVWMLGPIPAGPVSGIAGSFGYRSKVTSDALLVPRASTSGAIMTKRHLAKGTATVSRLLGRLGTAFVRPWLRVRHGSEQCLLGELFQDTASLMGEELVQAVLACLRRTLRVRYVLLVETLDHTKARVRQCCSADRDIRGLEYDISGSPCEGVMGRELCCYPIGVKARFPDHLLVRTLDVEAYLGVPLFGQDGRAIGLLALLHDAPLTQSDLAVSACRPLARRISAELERTRIEQDLRRSERHFREVAFHDQLTGLASRLLLMDRLEQALERARRAGHGVAVLFLDIDGFKRVNDSAGHDIGDQVLVDAARRIAGCVRSADTVARLGGDELVVLLEQCGGPREAALVAEHILCVFSHPFRAAGHCWSLSTSIGISLYEGSRPDIRGPDLLKQADRAMYMAKRSGPGRCRLAPPESMRAESMREESMREAGEERLSSTPCITP